MKRLIPFALLLVFPCLGIMSGASSCEPSLTANLPVPPLASLEDVPDFPFQAPEEYAPLVALAAASAGIPAWILARVISAESAWDPGAIRKNDDGSRDLGIAQLSERWLPDFAWFDNAGAHVDPFDPNQAIPVAARYLARLYRASGDWRSAVAAYNCGLSRVLARAIPERSRAYVKSVFEAEEKF